MQNELNILIFDFIKHLLDSNFFFKFWIPVIQKFNIMDSDFGEWQNFLKKKLSSNHQNWVFLSSDTTPYIYLLEEYYIYFNDDINLYKQFMKKFIAVNSNNDVWKELGLINVLNYLSNYTSKNIGDEAYAFINPYKMVCYPTNWLNSLKLIEHIPKGSKKQGQFNGPDFIFLEHITQRKIGIETTYLTKNSYFNPHFKSDKGWQSALKTSNYLKISDLDSFINLCKERINEKNEASNAYKSTDKLYLVIYVNIFSDNALPSENKIYQQWWCYLAEYVLNKTAKDTKFEHIYIMN